MQEREVEFAKEDENDKISVSETENKSAGETVPAVPVASPAPIVNPPPNWGALLVQQDDSFIATVLRYRDSDSNLNGMFLFQTAASEAYWSKLAGNNTPGNQPRAFDITSSLQQLFTNLFRLESDALAMAKQLMVQVSLGRVWKKVVRVPQTMSQEGTTNKGEVPLT